jgi:hypothetical protein
MEQIALDSSVLVAVVTRPRDLALAREAGWYRIPLRSAPRMLAVEYVAFYQTAAFGAERWSVRYMAPLRSVSVARRRDLLPDEPEHPRADERYYRLALGSLQPLAVPLPSARLRRITFITTTYGQLLRARDVRELWRPVEAALGGWEQIWGAGIGAAQRPWP